jgi:hypothetical protein
MVGLCMIAIGRSTDDLYLAQRGVGIAVRGFAAATVTASATALTRWMWNIAGDEHSSRHERTSDGLLLWGGLGVGGLTLLALSGWGMSRLFHHRATRRRRQHALEHAHDTVAAAYGAYLADVLQWLDRPTLDDVSVPQTAALVEALAAADDARRSEDIDRYQRAVTALSTAWKAADDHARKTGLRHLEPDERHSVELARKLLKTALDGSGSEHERRSAYTKARTLLDGILVVPPKAIEALEAKHRLAVTP